MERIVWPIPRQRPHGDHPCRPPDGAPRQA